MHYIFPFVILFSLLCIYFVWIRWLNKVNLKIGFKTRAFCFAVFKIRTGCAKSSSRFRRL